MSALARQFVSYPKSGRTWIRYMLAELGHEKLVKFHHDGFEFNDGTLPGHDFEASPRLERYSRVDRLVYFERDPRDVMVSLYYQVTGRFRDFFGFGGSISDFIRHDYFGAHNLKRFRDLWAALAPQLGCLVESYESCHQNPARVLTRILRHYDIEASEAQVARAAEQGQFERMREVEHAGSFPRPWLQLRLRAPKVRRGRVGGYRDQLAAEDVAYLDAVFGL